MYKFLFLLGLLYPVECEEAKNQKYVDSLSDFDRHISHSLAYHYLWPWSQLMRASAALDAEKSLEEPQIMSYPDRFEVNINVMRFQPNNIQIKIRNLYIIVEGMHKEKSEDKQFMANHFVQTFVFPAGTIPEEVKAVWKDNGVLTISAPRHEVPPTPPERKVPILMELAEKPEKKEPEKKINNRVEKQPSMVKESSIPTSSASPIEQLHLVEATTHVGVVRKKELKTTTNTSKDNEVTKGGDGNGLDYALIEIEE